MVRRFKVKYEVDIGDIKQDKEDLLVIELFILGVALILFGIYDFILSR